MKASGIITVLGGVGALMLLGLMVVGFMVLLSAHREQLLLRYARVRSLLATWEG